MPADDRDRARGVRATTGGEPAICGSAEDRSGGDDHWWWSADRWRCRGTGRRPTGTCSSSAQENRRSIAPASRTSPVFRLTKPPLSSVATRSSIEGFCGRQFDPASPFSMSGLFRPFAPIVASRLQGADAFRLSVPALRGAAPLRRSGPHPKAPIGAAEKRWRKTCACRPPSLVGLPTFPAHQ
jgi:hypothetical protein